MGTADSRFGHAAAERFWERIRQSRVKIETITTADLAAAWAIGSAFPDQTFSIVDPTSFAVMERLRITQAASFDGDFAGYSYGRLRDRAFQVLR